MYKRNAKGWAKHLDFIVLDCLCLATAFFLGFWIRHGFFVNPMETPVYREIFIVIIIMNFMIILFLDTMKNVLKRGYCREMVATICQVGMLFLCTTAFIFIVKITDDFSRTTVCITCILYWVISYSVRLIWKRLILRDLQIHMNNALVIIANEDSVPQLIHEVTTNNYGHNKLVGVVLQDASRIGDSIEGVPIIASYDNIVEYVTNHWVDELLISIGEEETLPKVTIDTLTMMGVTVHIAINPSARLSGTRQTVGNIGGLLVLSSTMNYMSPRQYIIKRSMDILGGLAGCIITGILYLFLAPAIKKESPGPVFFTQERIGKNGRPFKIYKFRSMYLDAEERKAELMSQNRRNDNLMFKMDFDPRVIGNRIDENGKQKTGIGEFIRKYSLDEFPQFFNVLKGDMSMIGTRPPLVSEYNEYSAHHKARLATTPGITGLWQISGRSDVLDFEDVVELDTQYINNWSIGLDMKILFKTVMVVVKKEGSM